MQDDRFKVGDLVRLSAYGNKVQTNWSIRPNDLGIIVKLDNTCQSLNNPNFPFKVKWAHLPFSEKKSHSRRDLKYASR